MRDVDPAPRSGGDVVGVKAVDSATVKVEADDPRAARVGTGYMDVVRGWAQKC